jgi:hypothetical protein
MTTTVERVKDPSWRYRYLSLPWGAEEDPARYVRLVQRVEKLLIHEKVNAHWANIILGRQDANVLDLLTLVSAYENADEHVWSALVDGIVGGDHELSHAESMADVADRGGFEGFTEG